MILLAIETSCDETAIAIIKRARGKTTRFEVLSHKVLSQIDLHAQYGGVFPALAKREHTKAITQLIAECLEERLYQDLEESRREIKQGKGIKLNSLRDLR
jgi:N6-L-threonylcarbamoyladenine synthase